MSDTLLVEPSAASPATRVLGTLLRSREIAVAAVIVAVIVLTTLKSSGFVFSSDGWRNLLVTPSHADPEVTVFLTMWNLEEYWHGEVLDEVLERHGVPTGPEHTRAVRSRLGWRDRLAPIRQSMLANVIGEDFIATHMAWGAINEWCAHSAYTRLIQAEKHPVLTEILKRIAKQETRHVAFYNSQARDRLLRSKKARKIARLAFERSKQRRQQILQRNYPPSQ